MIRETQHSPLVSVIIIFLDENEFLGEAVESVLAQTYPHWELLLIDDGSTDGSTDIARRYAKQYPQKVQYFEHAYHKNRGMSASRNLGVHHARGEYVALLDGDDVWLRDKLEQQVEILRSNSSAAMVCGPVQWWHSWTGSSKDLQRDFIVALKVESDKLIAPPELLVRLLEHETVTTTVALLRRSAIEQVGGFEESFRGLYEDQVFFAKICSQSPIFVESCCRYRWRKHPSSSCSVAVRDGEYRYARLRFLTWLESYLSDQGMHDRKLWRALRSELRHCRHPVWQRFVSSGSQRLGQAAEIGKAMGRATLPAPICQWVKASFFPRH